MEYLLSRIAFFILFLGLVIQLSAQDVPIIKDLTELTDAELRERSDWSYTSEIGLNVTPLISQLVPFNLGGINSGLIGLKYRKYFDTRAFKVNFGANLGNDDFNSEVENLLYIGLGFEKRHVLDKKWFYTSGWELYLSGFSNAQTDDFHFGVAKNYGIEYSLNKQLYLSTEGALRLGIDTDNEGPRILFDLPVAIFLNVRIY